MELKEGDRIIIKDGVFWMNQDLSGAPATVISTEGHVFADVDGCFNNPVKLLRYEIKKKVKNIDKLNIEGFYV